MHSACREFKLSLLIILTSLVFISFPVSVTAIQSDQAFGGASIRSTQHGQPILNAQSTSISSRGKPIEYNWGPGAITSLAEDAARYENEIWAVINTAADWRALPVPQEEYEFAIRPIDMDGVPYIVSYFSGLYKSQDARGLFNYLNSAQGFEIINPEEVLVAQARAVAHTAKAPGDATAYAEARLVLPPEGSGQPPSVALAGEHWQVSGDHELTSFVYPAKVPTQYRLPEVQALAGIAEEFSVIYSLRIRQMTPDCIQLRQLFWISLTQNLSESDAIDFHRESYAGIHTRLQKYLRREIV